MKVIEIGDGDGGAVVLLDGERVTAVGSADPAVKRSLARRCEARRLSEAMPDRTLAALVREAWVMPGYEGDPDENGCKVWVHAGDSERGRKLIAENE